MVVPLEHRPLVRTADGMIYNLKLNPPPPYVYVGRGSKWGNPFRAGIDGNRSQVITLYEEWLLKQPALLAEIHLLHGRNLACWCAPLPCHAEVIQRLAEESQRFPSRFSC